MARKKPPQWFDSSGNPLPEGSFVHTLADEFSNDWFFKIPAVVRKRLIEDARPWPIIRVEFVGFGIPLHRTRDFKNGELTLIRDDEYILYLQRIESKIGRR